MEYGSPRYHKCIVRPRKEIVGFGLVGVHLYQERRLERNEVKQRFWKTLHMGIGKDKTPNPNSPTFSFRIKLFVSSLFLTFVASPDLPVLSRLAEIRLRNDSSEEDMEAAHLANC